MKQVLVTTVLVLAAAVGGYFYGVDQSQQETQNKPLTPTRVLLSSPNPERTSQVLFVRPNQPVKSLSEQPDDCWVITLFEDPPENPTEPTDTRSQTLVAGPK